jgi:hypothetical protein
VTTVSVRSRTGDSDLRPSAVALNYNSNMRAKGLPVLHAASLSVASRNPRTSDYPVILLIATLTVGSPPAESHDADRTVAAPERMSELQTLKVRHASRAVQVNSSFLRP